MGSSVQVEKKAAVWNLDDNMGDDDLINDDDLLDEADKVKPTEEELRVCATTKQRKACANCSCGLKEELETEEIAKIKENSQNAKSSCGNCYLGDAFRCAACPYRGLPAFKAGEKVTIDVDADDL